MMINNLFNDSHKLNVCGTRRLKDKESSTPKTITRTINTRLQIALIQEDDGVLNTTITATAASEITFKVI